MREASSRWIEAGRGGNITNLASFDGRDDLLVDAYDNSTDSSGAIYIFREDTLMDASLGEVTTDDVGVLFDTNVANCSAGTRLVIDSDLDGTVGSTWWFRGVRPPEEASLKSFVFSLGTVCFPRRHETSYFLMPRRPLFGG